MEKSSWRNSDDFYFANLLVDELPKKEAAELCLSMLEEMLFSYIYPYDIEPYFNFLASLLPDFPDSGYTVDNCQQRCLRELLEEKIAELSEVINKLIISKIPKYQTNERKRTTYFCGDTARRLRRE